MLMYKKGNILEAEADVLVNTVNSVGVMGKGIALQFKRHFPDNYDAYRKAIEKGLIKPGSVFIYQVNTASKVKYIANFATKDHWRSRSRYEWIKKGLRELKDKLMTLKVDSVAIPPLGCGHGALDWNKVKKLIEDTLSDLPLNVFSYEPSDEIKRILQKESDLKAKKLTVPRAALLHLFYKYRILGEDITEFVAEKLCYFLQRTGFDNLNLRFKKGYYGPYSGKVRFVLSAINGYYIKGFEQMNTKPFERLELMISKKSEVDHFIDKKFSEKEKRLLKRTEELIEGFETPYGLELLATVDYLISKGLPPIPDEIQRSIGSWSSRKSDLFSRDHIELAMRTLQDSGINGNRNTPKTLNL